MIVKVTDYIEKDLDWEAEECRNHGIEFSSNQLLEAEPDSVVDYAASADFIVINQVRLPDDVLARLTGVGVIMRHGAGYDNIDIDAATSHGILCAYQPGIWSEEVAEHALTLMLAAWRKVGLQQAAMAPSIEQRQWQMEPIKPIFRLSDKTIGIVGCGSIGSLVLRKVRGLCGRVLVCDPYLSDRRKTELSIETLPFETVLEESDIVTIHVPHTKETEGMFDRNAFARMKSRAVLVNTARGPIVNVDDLAEALRNDAITGAGIDVYPGEIPDAGFPLLGIDTVLLTPHTAWYSEEALWDMRKSIMDDVLRVQSGGLPKHMVNPEVLERENSRLAR